MAHAHVSDRVASSFAASCRPVEASSLPCARCQATFQLGGGTQHLRGRRGASGRLYASVEQLGTDMTPEDRRADFDPAAVQGNWLAANCCWQSCSAKKTKLRLTSPLLTHNGPDMCCSLVLEQRGPGLARSADSAPQDSRLAAHPTFRGGEECHSPVRLATAYSGRQEFGKPGVSGSMLLPVLDFPS